MVLIVKIVSVVIIIYGCMVVLKPRIMKKIVEEIKKDKMIYKINGVKTVISLLLVLAAASCSVPWIVFLIGSLGLLGGACVFIFKKKVIHFRHKYFFHIINVFRSKK